MTPAERHLLAALANGLTVALLDRADLPACRAAEQRLREAVHGWDAEGYAVPDGEDAQIAAPAVLADVPLRPFTREPWEVIQRHAMEAIAGHIARAASASVAGGVAADSASGGAQGAPDTLWRLWEVEQPPVGIGEVWLWRSSSNVTGRCRLPLDPRANIADLWWHPACDAEPTTRPPL